MRKNGKNRLLAKKRIIALAALLCAGLLFGCKGNSPETPSEPVPEEITVEGQKFVLTFHDEFDGKKLDREKWNYCPMWERGNIGGFWDGNCVKLDGGHLVLTALLDGDGVPHSGAIRSKGLFEQAKGYFTARCKLQKAHGLWSAFWLMCDGAKNVGHGAIDGAEIDVFESYNIDRGAINHAIHYDGYDADHQSWVTYENRPDVYDGNYHDFALLWTDTAYIYYIDGVEVSRLEVGDAEYPGCCAMPTYLKLTVECGTWAGTLKASELPDDALTVDHVRVYRAAEE